MAKNRIPIRLNDQQKKQWKESAITHIKQLYPQLPIELEERLLSPGALTPRHRLKGSILLEPDSRVFEAHYLKKGLAKLYSIHPVSSRPSIMHIWAEGSFIVLYKDFRENLVNSNYYIELIEDSELVTLKNTCINTLYKESVAVHEISEQVLIQKNKVRSLLIEIMHIDKCERLDKLNERFPHLRGRLSQNDITALIDISLSTLSNSQK